MSKRPTKTSVIVANTSEKSFKSVSLHLQQTIDPANKVVLCISKKKDKNLLLVKGPPRDFIFFDPTVPKTTVQSYHIDLQRDFPRARFVSVGQAVRGMDHVRTWEEATALLN